MNKKCLFAVVIVLVSLICLSACGALRDTADKNKALNESLPYYELNAANYDEISYNGLTYTITDECLEMSELQEEIGQVSKRFKNVAGEDFSFGYVYSIVDVDISNAVAVNINNEYRKADMQHLFGYMESLCRTKEIRLQVNTVSLPQMLKFDRVLIERAIMNVISNGLDYSPQGGTLYVDVQSNNGFVEISVTDEGTGFSKEALCHAQERFYMGDQSRNSKLHFGMGLYITNSIMEQHNGQLILENSKETGGAKVTMKLPC